MVRFLIVVRLLTVALAVAVEVTVVPCDLRSVAAAATDCSNTTAPLLQNCASYIENTSSSAQPDSKCCNPLKTVLADPEQAACLCSLEKASSQLALRALALPKACNISTTFTVASCNSTSASGATLSNSTSTAAGAMLGSPLTYGLPLLVFASMNSAVNRAFC